MLRLRCEGCGLRIDVSEEKAGGIISCGRCDDMIVVGRRSSQPVLRTDDPTGHQRWGKLLEALLRYELRAPAIEMPKFGRALCATV